MRQRDSSHEQAAVLVGESGDDSRLHSGSDEADLSLSGDEQVSQGPFPLCTDGAPQRLCLYELADGALGLSWCIDQRRLEGAADAFGADDTDLVVRLLEVLPDGVRHEVALAPVDSATGFGRYAEPRPGGRFVAEFGLRDSRGGWLLLSRSNGLTAVPAAAELSLRLPIPRSIAAADLRAEHRPLAAAFPSPYPLVGQPDSSAEARPVDALGDLSPVRRPLESALAGSASLADASLVGAALEGGGIALAARQARADAPERARVPRMPGDPGAAASVAVEDQSRRAPPASADEQQGSAALVSSSLGRGMADLVAGSMHVNAELRLWISAAPGSRVELGDHRFLLGPGGRATHSFAIDDPRLLESLLARLPERVD